MDTPAPSTIAALTTAHRVAGQQFADRAADVALLITAFEGGRT